MGTRVGVASYTYLNGVQFAQSMAKGIPVSNISALAVDQIAAMFWKAYPWPWTRQALTPIPLSDGVQDYPLQTVDLPKVWRIIGARITCTSVSPVRHRDVRVMRHLEPFVEQKVSWPNNQIISFEPEYDKVRLEAAMNVPSGTTYALNGEYQCFPPKITVLDTTIHFPDYHMDAYVNGLLWMLYRLADDDRAGTALKTPVGIQYTGQLGIFYDCLVMAKEAEEHGAGDTIYPEVSIGGSDIYFPGVFGF